MPFDPPFMCQLDTYYAEASALRTVADWYAFERRWLDTHDWPQRNPSPARSDETRSRLLTRDTRRWSTTFDVFDLTPAARHHYNVVFHGIGMAIRFPHLAHAADKSGRGWSRECAFCELWTPDPGDEPCPVCSRPLLAVYIEE